MLFRREYTLESAGFFSDFTDFHSHLLPNVDDGVILGNHSIEILKKYEECGVKKCIFTPHIMESYPLNNSSFLREKFLEFNVLYSGKLEISLAAEYMIDAKFEEHLLEGDMLTLWDNYLLIETSFATAPIHFIERIKAIMARGYFVVLAHPERYAYMSRVEYRALNKLGVLFQLNLLSLSGYYGKIAKEKAIYLLDNNMYFIVGSDTHNLDMFYKNILTMKLSNKVIDKLLYMTNFNIV